MTDSEVLQRVIEIAIENGYDGELLIPWRDPYGLHKLKSVKRLVECDIEHLIYNHEFAKALFGDNKMMYHSHAWQFHLQAMVISPDPIDYLRRWLDENS